MKTEIICLLLTSHILSLHCNCVWCKFTLTSQTPVNTKHTSIKGVCELDNWRMCVWALSEKVYLYLLSLLETSSDHILQSHTSSGGKIHKGVLRHLWWGWPSYHYGMAIWLGWYRHNCVNLNEITVNLCKPPSVFIISLHKDEGWNVLEPITGMDIPFSSLTGPSSVVMVPSTGGFGGVMLQKIKVKKKRKKKLTNQFALNCCHAKMWRTHTCGDWGPTWWNFSQHDNYYLLGEVRRHLGVPCWEVSDNDNKSTLYECSSPTQWILNWATKDFCLLVFLKYQELELV